MNEWVEVGVGVGLSQLCGIFGEFRSPPLPISLPIHSLKIEKRFKSKGNSKNVNLFCWENELFK
jgi:hypothetical protein